MASTLSDEERSQGQILRGEQPTLRPIELDRLWDHADDEYPGSLDAILGNHTKIVRANWVASHDAQTDIKDHRPIDKRSQLFSHTEGAMVSKHGAKATGNDLDRLCVLCPIRRR